MFRANKENAKLNLRGRILKSFSVILSSSLSFFVFVLSSFGCVYLLVIDTEFLGRYCVFENQIVFIAACAFAVSVNIVLLLLYIYFKLKKDVYFYYYDETENIRISVNTVCKAFCVYTLKIIKKVFLLMFFTAPFTAVSVYVFYFIKSGISQLSLIVFIFVAIFLLLLGRYSYMIFIQKYDLLPLVLVENQEKSINEIFILSAIKMNGICKDFLKLKISNFPKKVFCLLILPGIYYLPFCRAAEADFVLQKEKPYMRRRAYTEKPIVFYFKQVKEN